MAFDDSAAGGAKVALSVGLSGTASNNCLSDILLVTQVGEKQRVGERERERKREREGNR